MDHWRRYVIAIWIAFALRGVLHALVAPMWDGFDEPFHLAYVTFVADHGRPPGFTEPSLPAYILETNRFLPSAVKYGAPSFEEWRRFSAEEKRERRARMHAATARMPRAERTRYMSANYERQQGPLYYYVMAPVALLFQSASLPVLLVVLRIASVLLVSLVVPIGASLLREVLPRDGAVIVLPLLAFLPNTLFYAFRLSNEALAWPLFALCCVAIVRQETWRAGVLLALGVWTKLTLLVAWGGAAVERGRVQRLVIPVVATAVLATWNRIASGTWTGLAEATNRGAVSGADWIHGLSKVFGIDWWRRLLELHAWSGGWGFVTPERWILDAILIAFALVLVLLLLLPVRNAVEWRRLLPLAAIALTMLAAMIYHGVTGAIASLKTPGFPDIGAEGWYLDLIRPVEVALFGALLVSRLPQRLFGAARWTCLVLPLVADAAGTFGLLLPRWGRDAMPVPVGNGVLLVLVFLFLAAVSAGYFASPDGSVGEESSSSKTSQRRLRSPRA